MSSLNNQGALIRELMGRVHGGIGGGGRALVEGTACTKAQNMKICVVFWELVGGPAQAGPSLREDSKAKGWRVGNLAFCPERSERLRGKKPEQGWNEIISRFLCCC